MGLATRFPNDSAMTAVPHRPRLVIFRIGSLGDTIVALPCFHAIAAAFPDHERLVLTNVPVAANAPALIDVLGQDHLVHGCISYPVKGGLGDRLHLLRQLQALAVETVVYLAPSRTLASVVRDFIFFKLSGAKSIIGLPWTHDLRACRLDSDGTVEREGVRLGRTLSAAIGPIDFARPAAWDLRLSDDENSQATALLGSISGPLIAINMGGKDVAKDWGAENWSLLVAALSQRFPSATLAVLGALSDRERAEAMSKSWRGALHNLAGRCSPRVSAAVLKKCDVFIGHDSGPLHLAAAVGTPSVGLFGSFNKPQQWHPFGSHVRILHPSNGLTGISVDAVLAEAVAAIPTPAAKGACSG
jgi:heptosyltransferase-3